VHRIRITGNYLHESTPFSLKSIAAVRFPLYEALSFHSMLGARVWNPWQSLQALFLGGITVLTPQPIDIGATWVRIDATKPLSAITSGAALQLDITALVPPPANLIDRMATADRLFPRGCVHARLVTSTGSEVALSNAGAAASDTNTYLIVDASSGVPTGIKFPTVIISATCSMKKVTLSWQNYSK